MHGTTPGSTVIAFVTVTPGKVFIGDPWSDIFSVPFLMLSLVAQRLKRLPAMRETRVQSLGREDPLEKETATHSSILA